MLVHDTTNYEVHDMTDRMLSMLFSHGGNEVFPVGFGKMDRGIYEVGHSYYVVSMETPKDNPSAYTITVWSAYEDFTDAVICTKNEIADDYNFSTTEKYHCAWEIWHVNYVDVHLDDFGGEYVTHYLEPHTCESDELYSYEIDTARQRLCERWHDFRTWYRQKSGSEPHEVYQKCFYVEYTRREYFIRNDH